MNEAVANLLLRITGESTEGESALARMTAALRAFSQQDGTAELDVRTRGAARNLKSIAKELSIFTRDTYEAKAGIDVHEARVRLDGLEHQLGEIDREHVSPEINIQITKALAKIAQLRAAMSAAAHQGGGLDDAQVKKIVQEFATLTNQVNNLSKGMDRLGGKRVTFFSRISDALRNTRVNLGPFSISLAHLGRIWTIMLPKAVALAAGIIAIGSSALAAVGGLIALSVAAIGAGGAIATLGIGAITAFVKGSEAVDEYRTAMETLRAAVRAQAEAERNLADAQEQSRRSQRDLVRARREAAENIADELEAATRAVADAEYNLQEAQEAVITAQEGINEARRDAIRTLEDLRDAVRSTALSQRDAKLDLKEARMELEALEAAGVRGLDLQRARLEVQQKEQALKEARREGTRAQEDLQEAEAKGIAGSDQMVAAREALADAYRGVAEAQVAMTDASERMVEAQKATIRRDDQVVAARQAVRAANDQVRDSERALAEATRQEEKARKEANEAHREAAPVLTAAGTALRKAVNTFQRELKAMLGPGIQQIFKGAATALDKYVSPLLRSLRSGFTELGGVMSDSLVKVAKAMSGTGGQQFFQAMLDGAKRAVPLLTRSFIALARIFGHIAQAAMPYLIKALRSIARWLEEVGNKTSDLERLGDIIGTMVRHGQGMLEFFGAVIEALGAIGRGASGSGESLLTWLTEMISKWAEWANSVEGQTAIQEFFKKMEPLFKSTVRFFGALIAAAVALAPILVPALVLMQEVFTEFLNIITDILKEIGKLPEVVQLILGGLLVWVGPLKILRKVVGWLFTITGFKGALKALGRIVLFTNWGGLIGGGGLLAKVASGIRGVIDWIKKIPSKIGFPGGSGGLIGSKVSSIGKFLFGRALPAAGAFAIGWQIGEKLREGIEDVFGEDFLEDMFGGSSWSRDIQDTLSTITSNAAPAFKSLPRKMQNAFNRAGGFASVFTNEEKLQLQEIFTKYGDISGTALIREKLRAFRQSRPRVADALSNLAKNAANKMNTKPFFNAGKSIVTAVANGIRAAAARIPKELQKIAKKGRDKFPGSEPKDPSSPLRNLSDAGAAIVENISKGIKNAKFFDPSIPAGKLIDEGFYRRRGAPWPGPAKGFPGGRSNTFNMPVSVASGGYPDVDSMMAAASQAARQRGLSFT